MYSRTGWPGRSSATMAATAILLVAGACGGVEGTTGPDAQTGPGNGSMSAKINGVAWSATFTLQAMVRNGHGADLSTMQIAGTDTTGVGAVRGKEIIITLVSMQEPATGSYPLDMASIGLTPGYSASAELLQGGAVWSTWPSSATATGGGKLTVTTLTATRIAGTFAFTAVGAPSSSSAGTGPLEVTEGKFDIKMGTAGPS